MTDTAPDDGARDDGREALLAATAPPVPKKKRRWFLRIALGTPVLLALLVLSAPTLLSTGPVRREIEAQILAATGRKATLGDHSLGWWGPATLEDLTLYERDGTTPILKVRRISVDVAHRPLMDNVVVLRACEVAGVEVRIVRRRDGTLSTDELLRDMDKAREAAPKKPAPPPDPAAKPLTFTPGPVALTDVTVTFVDEQAGRTFRATGLTVHAKPGATPDEIVAAVAATVEVPGSAPGKIEAQATLLALDRGAPRGEVTGRATASWSGFDLAAIAQTLAPMPGTDTATGPVDGKLEAALLPGGNVDATLKTRIPALRYGTPGETPLITSTADITEIVSWKAATGKLEILPGSVVKFAGAEIQTTGAVTLPSGPMDILARFDGEMSHFPGLFPSSLAGHDMKGTLRSNWTLKGETFDVVSVNGIAEFAPPFYYRVHNDDGSVTEYLVPHPGFFNVAVNGTWDGKRRARRAADAPGRPWASLDGLSLDLSLESPWVKSPSVDIKQIDARLELREQAATLRRFQFVLNSGKVICDGAADFSSEDPSWQFRTRVDEQPVKYAFGFSGLAALVNPGLYSTERGQVEAAMGWDIALRGKGFGGDALAQSLAGEGSLVLHQGVLAGSPMLTQLWGALKLADAPRYEFTKMEQKFRIDAGKVVNEWANWQGKKEADISISGETSFDGTMNQTIRVTGDAEARWGSTTAKVVKVFNDAGGIPLRGTVSAPKISIDYEKALEGAVKGLLDDPEIKKKGEDLFDDIFRKKKKK